MRKNTIFLFLLLTVFVGCRKDASLGEQGACVSFSSENTKLGLASVFEDFRVWASTMSGESGADLMEGYRVYNDAAIGWTYTEVAGTEGQELQYWSYSIDSYRFHAGAPISKVTAISASSLNLEALSTQNLSETCMFSSPSIIRRADPAFGNVVNLQFNYAQCRINLAFKYVSSLEVNITNIRLLPPAAYATAATIGFDYIWETGRLSYKRLDINDISSESIVFGDVCLPSEASASVACPSPWYMIPDPASKGQWTLSVEVNGVERQTPFTVSKAWEPGKSYLYNFEYTEDSKLLFTGTDIELFEGKDLENGGEHNFS